ncbi:hypothetical protein BM221_010068 [Beauveria bassiana]|uniref:Uncharacterized protein n=1 Tax=Beauveria bassiana TaxID=176275 RepID=A0A2N6NAH0_BEABA|nr:hypothetical protein BM221_010068 [Beauveria bassiana]
MLLDTFYYKRSKRASTANAGRKVTARLVDSFPAESGINVLTFGTVPYTSSLNVLSSVTLPTTSPVSSIPVKLAGPAVAPGVAVVVAVKQANEAWRGDERLHKGDVAPSVAAAVAGARGVVGVGVARPAVALAVDLVVVDARVPLKVDVTAGALLLQHGGGVDEDMHKRNRRHHPAVLVRQLPARGHEPVHHGLVDPVGLAGVRAVILAAAAVEEPEQQLRHAGRFSRNQVAAGGGGVDGEVVVYNAGVRASREEPAHKTAAALLVIVFEDVSR